MLPQKTLLNMLFNLLFWIELFCEQLPVVIQKTEIAIEFLGIPVFSFHFQMQGLYLSIGTFCFQKCYCPFPDSLSPESFA